MEKFGKYWGLIVGVLGVLAGVAGWLYNQGAQSKSLEGKTFKSPEERVKVVDHVLKAPSPEKIWRKYYTDSIKQAQDSIDRILVIKSRAKRDSLLIEEHKLNQKNAVQVYQMKEELEFIKRKLNAN